MLVCECVREAVLVWCVVHVAAKEARARGKEAEFDGGAEESTCSDRYREISLEARMRNDAYGTERVCILDVLPSTSAHVSATEKTDEIVHANLTAVPGEN